MNQENYVLSERLQFAPFRTVNDFVTDARFEFPAFNDLSKWNKRIVTNLLYFQTNYFVVFSVLFFLFSCYFGENVLFGLTALFIGLAIFAFSFTRQETVKQFRTVHPYAALAIIVCSIYYLITQLPYISVTLFCFGVPLLVVLLHASLRLRNFSAKINYELEFSRFRRTLMATMLDFCGIDLK